VDLLKQNISGPLALTKPSGTLQSSAAACTEGNMSDRPRNQVVYDWQIVERYKEFSVKESGRYVARNRR